MHISNNKKEFWKAAGRPILLLAFSLSLGLIFYATLLYYSSEKNELSSKIYEQSLVASINQYEYLPALLSIDKLIIETILAPKENRFRANRKLNFTAKRAGADAVYVMDIDGNVIASSNYNNPTKSFLDKNYSFRPYFKNAITERVRQFYYAKGATTGIPGFFISDPIIYKGQPVGVVVVKLNMSYWEKNWKNSKESVIATDENNVVILSSEDRWRYQSIGTLSDNLIDRIKLQQQFTGKEHRSIYTKSFTFEFFDNFKITLWLLDSGLYVIHKYSIPEVDWSLYYLVKHEFFLFPSLAFFFAILAISFSIYFMRQERKHKLASIYKTQQMELTRQEELKAVINNVHVGIILFSQKGHLVSINNHTKHLLFDGKIPQPEQSIYINDIFDIDSHHLDELLSNDIKSQSYHETYALKNGRKNVPIMFSLSKLVIMEENLYLMTFVNIKRRKDAEDELLKINNSLEDTINMRTQELRKAQEKLIQKNKATALGNMAATIVHELSQPLSAMNSSIAAVNAKIKNNDFDGAVESANRLTPLSKKMYNVVKLLKYFSYQDPSPENNIIDLTTVIEESLDVFKDILNEKNIILNYSTPHYPINIKANALKLDLALSNIIKNAIDASERSKDPVIDVMINTNDERYATITITDNGGGIADHIIQNMFSPYFTTKEVGKGLGLGLSITYEIIQEYYGKIAVSNTDTGACFNISLPLINEHYNSEKRSAIAE